MKRYSNFLIAVAGGILLSAAWPVSPLTLLIFVAWIPLLYIESKIKSKRRFFVFCYITMLIWNVATTWWIWNASQPGAMAAFLANSLIMCIPWLGFKIAKKTGGETVGYVSLIAFWLCFEFIHLHDWGLSWPWLTLGNVFATHTAWIQWYSFTGTSGGSLWVLIVNILLFLHMKNNVNREKSKTYKYLLASLIILIAPVFISWMLYPKQRTAEHVSGIIVVQPNIDPYEKISTGSFDAQLQKLIHLSEAKIDSTTTLVIWPETALYMENGIEEDKLKENYFLNPLWGFLKRHPQISLFTGIESYRAFAGKQTNTARSMGVAGYYYDSFNGSVLLDSSGALAFYHKSMLVPGVETLPWFLHFIDTWFEKFGGTTAGYAKQKERTVLATKEGYRIAPAICYESIYGNFMRKYFQNGANLICIITNDGWWKNTPGHKQHMNYARLRAIETRTWIARSANTGISCFIDPAGNVVKPQPWDTATAIQMQVPVEEHPVHTFFVKHGDIISWISTIAAIGLFIGGFGKWLINRMQKKIAA